MGRFNIIISYEYHFYFNMHTSYYFIYSVIKSFFYKKIKYFLVALKAVFAGAFLSKKNISFFFEKNFFLQYIRVYK